MTNVQWQRNELEMFPVFRVESETGLAACFEYSQMESLVAEASKESQSWGSGREHTLPAAPSDSQQGISSLGLPTDCRGGQWGWKEGRREGKEEEKTSAADGQHHAR